MSTLDTSGRVLTGWNPEEPENWSAKIAWTTLAITTFSLMLGFTARAGTSDLRIDDGEIAAAEWYTREQLRAVVADGTLGLPGRLSIARRLIEGWFGEPLTPPREVPFHRPDASHLDGPPSSGR